MRRSAILALAISAGMPGHAHAQAAVSLNVPSAIVFDAQGNLYFADTGNHEVRKFSAAGILTVVAGTGVQGFAGDNGPATAAELDSPAGVAMDAAGNLYIADTHNHRVREVLSATGVIATIAGTGVAGFAGDGGPATAARLDLPTALALDAAGDVFVADTDNHRVRRIAQASGVITTVAGDGVEGFSGDNGAATAAAIDSPSGLVLDAAGNLYLADTHNGRVRMVDAASGLITTLAGAGTVGGNVQAFGGDGGSATAAGLALPRGITIDAAGNLYIADSANHRIRRISPAGVITTVTGQGTETFAGDGAPAVTASLDSPRSVAVSPSGLLTLADTANQRIRQLDALPAPGPDIRTIAGVGSTAAVSIMLSGPAVLTYGSGTVTATLASATIATGTVTFADTISGTATTLGTASLSADAATFSTSALAAGTHSIVASYPGDANHVAAQSSAVALTVTPLRAIATPNPASIVYGQTVPTLSGTLSGILAQDAGKVSALFTTSATALSPAGAYPIAATLTGSSAGDYTASTTPANLSIAQAPTLTTLAVSIGSSSVGLPIIVSMHATTTTSGVPTGAVTLFDGSTSLAMVQLAGGSASFTTSALSLGGHTLTAAYSGDPNFLPSASAVAAITVGVASDFTLTAMGATSQSIPAGSAATFNFAVAMQGAAIASPIALAVQGTPLGATASLSPTYLPPGGAVTAFTLTIQTPLARLDKPAPPFVPVAQPFSSSALLAIMLLPAIGFTRRFARIFHAGRGGSRMFFVAACIASFILLTALTTGCGNRVNTGPESVNAVSYTLTVTGTATSPTGTALQHTASVSLEVL